MFATLINAALILLLCVGSAYADPTISGATGTFSDGGSITITSGGSDFGSGPNIDLYDNFEAGSNNTVIPVESLGTSEAVIGDWDRFFNDSSTNVRYSSNYARSGNMSLVARSGNGADTGLSARIIHNFDTPSTEFFGSYWTYKAGSYWPYQDGDWNGGAKLFWVHSQVDHFSSDAIFPTCAPVGSGADTGDPYNNCNIYGNYVGSMSADSVASFYSGIWYRWDFYWNGSSTGSGVVYVRRMQAGQAATVETNLTGQTNSEAGENYILVEFGHWSRANPTYLIQWHFDDVYLATGSSCRARVEIGDNATYANCTNLSICTPTAWAAGEITATLRKGSFTSGTAYLFVIDSNNVASSGYQISFGGAMPCGVTPPMS